MNKNSKIKYVVSRLVSAVNNYFILYVIYLIIIVITFYLIALLYDTNKKEDIEAGPNNYYQEQKPLTNKLVIILIDGLRWEQASNQLIMENLNNMGGCYGISKTGLITLTSNRLRTIFTGRENYFQLDYSGFSYADREIDSILKRAKNKNLAVTIVGGEDWPRMFEGQYTNIYFNPFKGVGYIGVDNKSLNYAKNVIASGAWDILIIELTDLDCISHQGGCNQISYLCYLKKLDQEIGTLWKSIKSNGTLLVTAHHACTQEGFHGTSKPEMRETPYFIFGKGVKNSGRIDINQVDLSSIVAALIGVSPPSNCEGMIPARVLNTTRDNLETILINNSIQKKKMISEYAQALPRSGYLKELVENKRQLLQKYINNKGEKATYRILKHYDDIIQLINRPQINYYVVFVAIAQLILFLMFLFRYDNIFHINGKILTPYLCNLAILVIMMMYQLGRVIVPVIEIFLTAGIFLITACVWWLGRGNSLLSLESNKYLIWAIIIIMGVSFINNNYFLQSIFLIGNLFLLSLNLWGNKLYKHGKICISLLLIPWVILSDSLLSIDRYISYALLVKGFCILLLIYQYGIVNSNDKRRSSLICGAGIGIGLLFIELILPAVIFQRIIISGTYIVFAVIFLAKQNMGKYVLALFTYSLFFLKLVTSCREYVALAIILYALSEWFRLYEDTYPYKKDTGLFSVLLILITSGVLYLTNHSIDLSQANIKIGLLGQENRFPVIWIMGLSFLSHFITLSLFYFAFILWRVNIDYKKLWVIISGSYMILFITNFIIVNITVLSPLLLNNVDLIALIGSLGSIAVLIAIYAINTLSGSVWIQSIKEIENR